MLTLEPWPRDVLLLARSLPSRKSYVWRRCQNGYAIFALSAEAMASSLETVQSREDRDFDQEWEKLPDEGSIARETFRHNL